MPQIIGYYTDQGIVKPITGKRLIRYARPLILTPAPPRITAVTTKPKISSGTIRPTDTFLTRNVPGRTSVVDVTRDNLRLTSKQKETLRQVYNLLDPVIQRGSGGGGYVPTGVEIRASDAAVLGGVDVQIPRFTGAPKITKITKLDRWLEDWEIAKLKIDPQAPAKRAMLDQLLAEDRISYQTWDRLTASDAAEFGTKQYNALSTKTSGWYRKFGVSDGESAIADAMGMVDHPVTTVRPEGYTGQWIFSEGKLMPASRVNAPD